LIVCVKGCQTPQSLSYSVLTLSVTARPDTSVHDTRVVLTTILTMVMADDGGVALRPVSLPSPGLPSRVYQPPRRQLHALQGVSRLPSVVLRNSVHDRTTCPTQPSQARVRESRHARQRSGASSPERPPSAPRRSHRLDRPEATPRGSTRKPERHPRTRRVRGILISYHLTSRVVSPIPTDGRRRKPVIGRLSANQPERLCNPR